MPEPDGAKPPRWQDDRGNLLLLLLLYTLQGVPMGMAKSVPFLMSQQGNVDYASQAVFALCTWPFSLKLLWAPIVDSLALPAYGRRKSWLVPVQLLAAASLMIGSTKVDDWMGADGSEPEIYHLTAMFFGMYFLMATQDIAVDGWCLTMLQPHNVELGSTCNSIGQNLGSFISFVGFLALNDGALADRFLRAPLGLAATGAPMVALPGFLFVFGLLMLAVTLAVALLKTERREGEGGKEPGGLVAAYIALTRIVRLPAVMKLAAALFFARAAFACSDNVASLKMIEYGMPKTTIASISSVLLPVAMATPVLLKRFLPDAKPLRVFLWCLPLRLAINVFDFFFIPMVMRGWTDSGALVVWVTMAVYWVVVTSAMFTAQMEFFSSISDPAMGGTYMTLLNTFGNLGNTWPQSVVLWAVDYFSLKDADGKTLLDDTGYPVRDGFFVVNVGCSIVGVAFLALAWRRVAALDALPKASWRCALPSGGKGKLQ